MSWMRNHGRVGWLAVGLLGGVMLAALWPNAPLHAVSTDRFQSFAIATGFLEEDVEALYFLDVLTGTLKAAVLSNATPGFHGYYEANLNNDLATVVEAINNKRRRRPSQGPSRATATLPEIQVPQMPNYMLVTGLLDLRRGTAARTKPALSVVYVAETNTGIVMAYVLPWDQGAHASNMRVSGKLTLWAFDQFTTALVRTP